MIRYLIQLLNRNRAGDALAQDLIRDANNFPLVPAARRGLDFWIRGLATYLQLCFVFLTALSLALFVHSLFLTQFLPERLFETEVPMTFEPCAEHMGRCSFLRGTVNLNRLRAWPRYPVIVGGQPYVIELVLHVPESSVNKDVGMVRICLQLLDQRKEEIRQVRTNFQGTPMAGSGYCKTTMLEHKSRTFGVVSTLLRAPFLLFKMDSESQKIPVVMHSDFEIGPKTTVTQANVMIHSRHFQVYDIRLRITAEFSGLRYMVYNYPGTFLAFSLVMNITVLVWVMFGLITGIFLHGMAA